jgi:hypothetical protein
MLIKVAIYEIGIELSRSLAGFPKIPLAASVFLTIEVKAYLNMDNRNSSENIELK